MYFESRHQQAKHWHKLHQQGMSYEQIAEADGVTKGVVAGAIWRHVHKSGYKAERQNMKAKNAKRRLDKQVERRVKEIENGHYSS
jgi:transposase